MRLFSHEYIYAEMRKSTVEQWFMTMSIGYGKSLNKIMASMLKLVGDTNDNIVMSRRIQHEMGYFSPRPVASLTNPETKDRVHDAIMHYAPRAQELSTKFENVLPQQSTGSFSTEWSKLCEQAICIIAEMAGVLAVLAGRVNTGTRASVAAAKERAETDMQKAVELSAKMKWLH